MMKTAVAHANGPEPRTVLRQRIIDHYGTIQNFAWAAGCSNGTVSTACSGHSDPPQERKVHWAELLESTVQDIFPDL